MTLAQSLRPVHRTHAFVYDLVVVIGGSFLIAASAHIALPVPFSPVPVTGQTFAVLFLGALLGSARGASAVLAYLGQGIAGLAVFAGGGAGIAHLAGPTGGYLVGFVGAAYVTGYLAERGWNSRVVSAAAAMALGNGVIYAVGAAWLGAFVGLERAFALGVLPFLVGDALKIGLATVLLPMTSALVRRG
jgi:biotin transport system substrate-specific component